jgi:hypothetical protein
MVPSTKAFSLSRVVIDHMTVEHLRLAMVKNKTLLAPLLMVFQELTNYYFYWWV